MVLRTVLACVAAVLAVEHTSAACLGDPSKALFALYQTYTVTSPSDEVDVTLRGFSQNNRKIRFQVTELPSANGGSVHKPSQVYCDYSYSPKADRTALAAAALPHTPACSTPSLIYKPKPNRALAREGPVGVFSFVAEEYHQDLCSDVGKILMLNPDGVLAASFFDRSADGWTIVSNGPTSGGAASYDASSRGTALNRYVYGEEEMINVQMPLGVPSDVDATMWYFKAPPKFLSVQGVSRVGDMAAAYGGKLKFVLGHAAGDFVDAAQRTNKAWGYLVRLECETCKMENEDSGIQLAYELPSAWDGTTQEFEIPLVESSWLKDPENTNGDWLAPTKCEMYQVLHRLSGLQILGDHLLKYESVMLDSVKVIAGPTDNLLGECYADMHTAY